jgi:hypothetical protein
MKCLNPVKLSRGRVVPCGKCFSCRSKRRSQWAARLREESKFHLSQGNCCLFLTLTYNDENVPRLEDGTAVARIDEFSGFIKRLRKRLYGSKRGPLRYFGVSEYGPKTLRPHYHAILFGFPKLPVTQINKIIRSCWTSGFISVSFCNNRTIAYIKIYNDYFRDENLQGELKFECVDGGNETSGLSISSQIGGSSNPYQRNTSTVKIISFT